MYEYSRTDLSKSAPLMVLIFLKIPRYLSKVTVISCSPRYSSWLRSMLSWVNGARPAVLDFMTPQDEIPSATAKTATIYLSAFIPYNRLFEVVGKGKAELVAHIALADVEFFEIIIAGRGGAAGADGVIPAASVPDLLATVVNLSVLGLETDGISAVEAVLYTDRERQVADEGLKADESAEADIESILAALDGDGRIAGDILCAGGSQTEGKLRAAIDIKDVVVC